jgi:IS5 family transposase
MKQTSFAQAEFAAKKKTTRRERFLAEKKKTVPWSRRLKALSPYYYPDSRGKRGRLPQYLSSECCGCTLCNSGMP